MDDLRRGHKAKYDEHTFKYQSVLNEHDSTISSLRASHQQEVEALRKQLASRGDAGRTTVSLTIGAGEIPKDITSALEILSSSLDESERKVDEILALL